MMTLSLPSISSRRAAGAAPRPLLHRLGSPAEELIVVVFILDGRLVAAPPEGHVQRLAGHFLAFSEAVPAPAHADGQGRVASAAVIDVPHPVENVEPLLHQALQMPLLQDDHELLAGQLAHDAVGGGGPVFDFDFHVAADGRPFAVSRAGRHLVEIVDGNEGYRRAAQGVFLSRAPQLGLVHEVKDPLGHAADVGHALKNREYTVFIGDMGLLVAGKELPCLLAHDFG